MILFDVVFVSVCVYVMVLFSFVFFFRFVFTLVTTRSFGFSRVVNVFYVVLFFKYVIMIEFLLK